MRSEVSVPALVRRCQHGEPAAFEALFRRYQPRLRYYVRRLNAGGDYVEDTLQEELQGKLDLEARDANGLMTAGIALRNRFWELGGGLSEATYPYIYAARLAAEMAHQHQPENSAIIDQLAESIMAYEVLHYVGEPAPPGKAQKNPLYAGLLADLRGRQYQLLQAGLSRGATPTWKDFVRCCDFIHLALLREDAATCLEVTRLLIAQAEKAGWTFYLEGLQRGEQRLVAGGRYRGEITFTTPMRDVSLAQYAGGCGPSRARPSTAGRGCPCT